MIRTILAIIAVFAIFLAVFEAAPDTRGDGQCTGAGAVRNGTAWCRANEAKAKAKRRAEGIEAYRIASSIAEAVNGRYSE